MLIGYARVSTEDQHLDLQRDALARAGCEKTFEDKKSGAEADRSGLAAALEYARAGDQLVVWRLDRLGRSLPDLLALMRKLDEVGVQLRSVTEGIDTATINGKLTFHLFAALAEFERALVRERTKAGLEAARAWAHGRAQPPALAGQAPPCGRALPRQGQDRPRDLPLDGDLEAHALRLCRRSRSRCRSERRVAGVSGRVTRRRIASDATAPVDLVGLRISLCDVKPTAWRRIVVPAAIRLDQLHRVIQAAMGWEDAQLWSFHLHGVHYGPETGQNPRVPFARFRLRSGERFTYVYDFGDWWEHEVRVEPRPRSMRAGWSRGALAATALVRQRTAAVRRVTPMPSASRSV